MKEGGTMGLSGVRMGAEKKRRILPAGCLAVAVLAWSALSTVAAWAQHEHHHGPPGGGAESFFGDFLRLYTPRKICMFHEAPVIWLHVISDALIALSYYSIPIALIYFVRKRKDLAYSWVVWLFALFILACGTTHAIGVLDIWAPYYRLDGIAKFLTAIFSVATAVALWPLMPKALALPSPGQLEQTVRKRTAELSEANIALKNSEEQLSRAKAAAEAANAAKDQFLAVLSHELRTPLTPVLAAVSLIERSEAVTPKLRETLNVIRRNVALEARIIDDLLDLTRIVRGKVALERKPVTIAEVLDRVVEVCKPDLETRKIDFGISLQRCDLHVYVDISRMQQVFWNLLKNSIKFTPEGGRIEVHCRAEEGNVIVEVQDNGIGIEPEVLAKIFDAFEQASSRITRQFGGLGLGLAISKRLVEMHNGSISAYSQGTGKGATFRVVLPLYAGEITEQAETEQKTFAARREGKQPRILLVEDNGDTAQVMRKLLQGAGYEVRIAGDAALALASAAEHEFDLLISDIGLPDQSGLQLIEELRRRGFNQKAIAISGYGREEDVRKSVEAGFTEHITKPIDFDALLALVEKVANGQS